MDYRTAMATTVLGIVAAMPACAQELQSLPAYQPQQQIAGTLRIFGSDLAGQVKAWEDGFAKFHPHIRFDNQFPSSDGAMAGLVSGVADIGTAGREFVLTEYLMFNESFGYDPEQIAVATGAFDRKGKSWAIVVYVQKDNPISQLTLEQLDGIFGSERSGGYRGLKWMPQFGRGAEKNIRTWGQVGLTGDWANQPIQTYGYALTGMSNFFQLKVFDNGDKWNQNYRQYVEDGTKMVADGKIGETGSIKYMFAEELSKNRFGIAWAGIPHAAGVPQVKAIALAAHAGGPYIMPTRETVQNRTYPLSRSIFMYLKHAPGKPLEPKVKEFLRYVLSKEGQSTVVENGSYLPLTARLVIDERHKLDEPPIPAAVPPTK
jgi:phosphate transport system substrate-binding protein